MIPVAEKASMGGSRVADSKKNDVIGRILTGDLRCARDDFNCSEVFSLGDITARKANKPSWMV